MNFKDISQRKVCNKTFQNLDLDSLKLVLNLELSHIWQILEFGTKLLSRIRNPQISNFREQEIELSISVFPDS